MPNDIEAMAKQRTTSERKRRVKIAGLLRVARWRMVPVPLRTLSMAPDGAPRPCLVWSTPGANLAYEPCASLAFAKRHWREGCWFVNIASPYRGRHSSLSQAFGAAGEVEWIKL